MLQADRIACQRGHRALFSDISFTASGGDAVRIRGRNGSGKTSMLRMLSGLSIPASGEIRWQGKPLGNLREVFWRDLIYIGHATGLKDELLSWENLAIMARLAGHRIDRKQAAAALEKLGVARVCDLPVRVLSQGQRRRVALARLCLGMPMPLWILDEPAASLDDAAVGTLCGVLDTHLAQGGIVIHATHQDIPLSAGRHLGIDLDLDCQ